MNLCQELSKARDPFVPYSRAIHDEWADMSSSEKVTSTLGKSRYEKGCEVRQFMTARHIEGGQ